MKKLYFLKTCDTNKRIMNSIPLDGFILQEIKTQPITVEQIEEMYTLSGSYEALFSKRAKKYKQMNLKDQILDEQDYKQLILDEYTFLKRPVFIIGDKIFIGNSKKTVDSLQSWLIK